jgi:hypothetical protein
MRFPLAAEKLAHAQELLGMLQGKTANHSAFDALVNATLDAARSVTFVLQAELSGPAAGLFDWYEAKRTEMSLPRNNALPWLNESRVLTTHRRPLGMATESAGGPLVMRVPSGRRFVVTARGEPRWIELDTNGKEISSSHATEYDGKIQYKHFIVTPPPPSPLTLDGNDLTGSDVIEVLSEYVTFLQRLLQEAEVEPLP